MRDRTLIGPWIRRFLLEHLVSDRNLTHNTQASYRDTLLLLLPFVSQAQKKLTDRLTISRRLGCVRFCNIWRRNVAAAALRAIYVSPRSTHSRSSSACAAQNM
jgi:site-specific recombinase XerD